MTRPVAARAVIAMLTAASLSAGSSVSIAGTSQSTPEPLATRIDRLLADWSHADAPGCSVGVSRGDATVLERGYGQASVEHGVPITPQSVFHVALSLIHI